MIYESGVANLYSEINKWFSVSKTKANPTLRVICIPYVGGSAAVYRNWDKYSNSNVQFLSLQLPGRGSRYSEQPYTEMNSLINDLSIVMGELLLESNIPYIIYGHSMGALIGFELTRMIARKGYKLPSYVVVSGAAAPDIVKNEKKYSLPTEELKDILRYYNGTPKEILEDDELLEMFLPCIRSDLEIVEEYKFTIDNLLPCSIIAIGGENDHLVSLSEIKQWENHTQKDFHYKLYEGDHFFLKDRAKDIVRYVTENVNLQLRGDNYDEQNWITK